MAIFLLKRDTDDGSELVDDIDAAIVEAANAAAARTAALALDSRFPANYWTAAAAVDISTPGTYDGGLMKQIVDNGVP